MDAFPNCYSLTSIEVDSDSTSYASADGVLFTCDMTHLVKYPAAKNLTQYTVPDSVAVIDNHAFAYAHSLRSIDMPDGLKEIGYGALYNCTALNELVLPVGIETIKDSAFSNCKNIKM